MTRRPALSLAPRSLRYALVALWLGASLVGCGGEGVAGSDTTTGGGRGAGEPRTCTAPGLEQAQPVPPLSLTGCSFPEGGSLSAPRVLDALEDVVAALHCTAEVTPAEAAATLDLAAHDVYVVSYTMSPAFGGIAVYESGTTLTLLTRFRPNCPDDPMPMPMNSTLAWLVPKGQARTMAEATCSLPRDCD